MFCMKFTPEQLVELVLLIQRPETPDAERERGIRLFERSVDIPDARTLLLASEAHPANSRKEPLTAEEIVELALHIRDC